MLWQPSEARIQSSQMYQFLEHVNKKFSLSVKTFDALYQFSIQKPNDFWLELLFYFDVKYTGGIVPVNQESGFEKYGWFPHLKLNFSENLLRKGCDEKVAIKAFLESGEKTTYTYGELKAAVSRLQQALAEHIQPGDVVACYMPNRPETLITLLATAALGGVFTSTSCDFGVNGVTERLSQSQPKVLVTSTGYAYNGKFYDIQDRLAPIVEAVPSIESIIYTDDYDVARQVTDLKKSVAWTALLDKYAPAALQYEYRRFDDPLYIMYSSGTTGKPKCIVHSTGGVLLQHIKELGLHVDFREDKTLFFYTTCGWMMWNWLVSGLYLGGTLVLYEGSPAFPNIGTLFDLIQKEKINIFGTSPKFLKACEDQSMALSSPPETLETILSTGAPLLPEQYTFIYNSIKSDVQISSISGGTDILGCFFLGNPFSGVNPGTLQGPGLGMAVDCVDQTGESVPLGDMGELVCRESFPSRPLYFLNDPNNKKLISAYFSTYKACWYHGDFIKRTPEGGAIFYGRSDATLNPGGVRIGTSEIYEQLHDFNFMEDAVCVGKNVTGEVQIILFVKMLTGETLTEARIREIKTKIRQQTTPRHVPSMIYAVDDIPYTQSGKKVELAVSRMVNGMPVPNKDALINPESLNLYTAYR